MDSVQNEKQIFLEEITKAGYQFSETLFYQNIIFFN